jgi:cardiolipin synthase
VREERSRARLTFRRLSGLDRSGPEPPETRSGQPLRPWTIPNAIGFLRLALIPVVLVLGFSSTGGHSTAAAVLFAVIAWGDYADGIAARVTGQYSRLGALIDPVIDRLLIVGGLAIAWRFDTLPRWAIAVLVAREALMVVLARIGLSRGVDIHINWPGRAGVFFTFSAPFFALAEADVPARVCLYVGLVLSLLSTALYVRAGARELARRRHAAPGPSS